MFNFRRVFDSALGDGGFIRGTDWVKKPEVDNVYGVGTDTVVIEVDYYGTTRPRNAGYYSNEYFDTQMLTAMKELDPATRVQLQKEANLRYQDDCPAIPYAYPYWTEFWWPWMKNCYGEVWYQIHTPDHRNW